MVVQTNDYYPFGLTMKPSDFQRDGEMENNFLYNGKELQEETGWLDYGARMYQPEIGRWNGIDKMSDAYSSYSPYNYVLGNPIANTDVNGEWTVTRHHRMTMDALSTAGIGGQQAKLIAHYTSMYADNPGKHLKWNNAAHPTYRLSYRDDIKYSGTANSQVTNWSGAGTNYNTWHSMRSSWEKEQYDVGTGGISAAGAMKRGMKFGWSKVFESAANGKLSDLKKNSEGIQQFGQGVHALQDGYAHKGRHDVGADHLRNDRYGNTSEAEGITNSAVMVHSIMSGDSGTFNSMLEGGTNSLDLNGISGDNLIQLNDKVKANGNQLKYNWETKKYDIK